MAAVSRPISSTDRKKAIIIYRGATATEDGNPDAYYDFHWIATMQCEELMRGAEHDLIREGMWSEFYYFSWYRVRNVCEATQRKMVEAIEKRCRNESVVSLSPSAVEFMLEEFVRASGEAFEEEWMKLQKRLKQRGIW